MSSKKIFLAIKKLILDTLFPIECLFCQKPDEWICRECAEKIKILDTQVCPYCEKIISPSGRICQNCKTKFLSKNENFFLDALIVCSSYKKNHISRLIHRFKYNFIFDLSSPLAKIIIRALILHNLPLSDIIIPIPLHFRRLRWRGFNQAELLSEEISQNLTPNFPLQFFSDFILRKRFTAPQMKIKNYQARKNNLKNAFVINSTSDLEMIKDKTILLVDDVATTGSTIFECAKILKKSGAKSVFGVVLARQEFEI
jgi:ComF family protein